ncbi:hypothetical protein M885DRAFT_85589 [Pelagophyceae sp. CCMP2097]|nr:hypothetical protein M885DRAFT_85589 [Pelagophyceae sp. CCMP2097]
MVSWVAEPSPTTAFNQQRPVTRRVPFATGRLGGPSPSPEGFWKSRVPRPSERPHRAEEGARLRTAPRPAPAAAQPLRTSSASSLPRRQKAHNAPAAPVAQPRQQTSDELTLADRGRILLRLAYAIS